MAIAPKDCIVVFMPQSRRIRLHSKASSGVFAAAAAPMTLEIIDTGLC